MTFLRTVEEGPTDRSYGVHVADMAGVPGPVVERSATCSRSSGPRRPSRRAGRRANPSKPSSTSDSGGFRGSASADGGQASTDDAGDDEPERGPAEESVLAALRDTDIGATSPVELMGKVEGWQRELDDE